MDYVFGAYRLNTQRYELTHAGVPIPLRPKVFQVLAYLLAQHERVVSKEELLAQVWPGQFVGDVGLNSYLMAVRKALGDRRPPYQFVRTVLGHGYRFVAEVTTAAVEACRDAPAGATGGGVLTPLSPLATPPQTAPNLVPEPLLQGTAGTAHGAPEMDAITKAGSLERGAPMSTGEWKLVTVLCGALADPPPGASLKLEMHYRQLSALYALAREAVQRSAGPQAGGAPGAPHGASGSGPVRGDARGRGHGGGRHADPGQRPAGPGCPGDHSVQ
jgi:DNA-binding winged helix-turn-helix (wHTH) protein